MKRWHLFEWEDQPWLPAVFRDFVTDHLHTFMQQEDLFAPAVPLIADVLRATGQRRIVDLCSGGGGPYPRLVESLSQTMGEPVTATLTDLFPNRTAAARFANNAAAGVSFREQATSAFAVPSELVGMRTIFTALHHFQPHDVRAMLADAVRNGQAFGAFEVTRRDLFTLITIGGFSFLRGLLATHQIGPLTLSRILATYVVPVAPMIYSWDGMVSCLRSYTPAELLDMTSVCSANESAANEVSGNGYQWRSGEIPARHTYGDYCVTYLIGTPPRMASALPAAA